PRRRTGIHPTAVIDPEARIADDVYIGPYAVVGRCDVGTGSVIHAHVTLYDGVRIGRNVTIHAGTAVGTDGFGYSRAPDGSLEHFPHVGGVVIEDEVEIGSNTCIDRGTLGDTTIREGTKVDNLVHIAHNVTVGRHALVIAHAMIGGSTVIGDGAWVAPSSAIRDGVRIGDGATIGIAAVVVKNVDPGETVMGVPARPASEYKATLAKLKSL
ncbi:MAG TPA: UDP-3-O-(3-hydroxymyristoyl)glucosamine N-acyltransferase, partial [Nitrospira sp.]|nr:UDP-3-O-(3-hydroxymyristoyl)glucosamine N-acyltransferase [Nitrospira sp.]